MNETLLKVDDALAARLGLSRWGLYQAIRSGHIAVVRLGRRVRVPASEIDRLTQDARAAHAARATSDNQGATAQ